MSFLDDGKDGTVARLYAPVGGRAVERSCETVGSVLADKGSLFGPVLLCALFAARFFVICLQCSGNLRLCHAVKGEA